VFALKMFTAVNTGLTEDYLTVAYAHREIRKEVENGTSMLRS